MSTQSQFHEERAQRRVRSAPSESGVGKPSNAPSVYAKVETAMAAHASHRPALGIGSPSNETTEAAAARRREERRLPLRYHRADDAEAREALVRRFMPLARKLARRYPNAGEPMDDLIQVASLGLLNAIDRFDPARETTLSSFAIPTILGELKRHFRDHGWALHVPRSLQERAQRVEQANNALWRQLGRPPTSAEIAARVDATPEQVSEARQAGSAYRTVPLDHRADELDGESPIDRLAIEERGFELAETAATVEQLMSALTERQREILRLSFDEDLVQREISDRIGLSQVHVSRVLRQSIKTMRALAE
jgi:RNA polymerase sigma-B factor